MAKKIRFSKWHGLGNDFIIVDDRQNRLKLTSKQVAFLSHRQFGIGCDQFMIVKKSKKADIKLELYNQNGGKAEMCGNGIRCFAIYLYNNKIVRKKEMTIETGAGIIKPKLLGKGIVEVDMGEPVLEGRKVPMNRDGQIVNTLLATKTGSFHITAVSMGNPHAVTFVDDVEDVELAIHGPSIENHLDFPNRTNVEFAQIVSRKKIKLRVWERGVGPTLACGTGACATAVAGVLNNLTDRRVSVVLPGGTLKIFWREKDNRVIMTGPTTEVFNSIISI